MRRIITIVLAIIFSSSWIADAELHSRDSGLLYDDVLDLTWFRNVNYAVEEDSDVPEMMRWADALAWVAALDHADCTDWRLPNMDVNGDGTIVDGSSVSETLCRDNELGYMYYQSFGAGAGDDKSGTVVVDGVTIENLGSCWSSTVNTIYPGLAKGFSFFNGAQGDFSQNSRLLAWVVTEGDLSPTYPTGSEVTWQGEAVTWQGEAVSW